MAKSNKEKMNEFITDLRKITEEAKWGFMVTRNDVKPIVGQQGKVTDQKAEATVVITVDKEGHPIKLG